LDFGKTRARFCGRAFDSIAKGGDRDFLFIFVSSVFFLSHTTKSDFRMYATKKPFVVKCAPCDNGTLVTAQ
jgi:hypothetical protein